MPVERELIGSVSVACGLPELIEKLRAFVDKAAEYSTTEIRAEADHIAIHGRAEALVEPACSLPTEDRLPYRLEVLLGDLHVYARPLHDVVAKLCQIEEHGNQAGFSEIRVYAYSSNYVSVAGCRDETAGERLLRRVRCQQANENEERALYEQLKAKFEGAGA